VKKKGKQHMAKCKELSINLAVLAPSNKRQFSFGMMRGCIDDKTPFYVMVFVLRDLINNEFQDRVSAGKITPSGGKEVEDKKMNQLGQQLLTT
jgi:hypothetical protein